MRLAFCTKKRYALNHGKKTSLMTLRTPSSLNRSGSARTTGELIRYSLRAPDLARIQGSARVSISIDFCPVAGAGPTTVARAAAVPQGVGAVGVDDLGRVRVVLEPLAHLFAITGRGALRALPTRRAVRQPVKPEA